MRQPTAAVRCLGRQPQSHAFATDGSDQLRVTTHHEQGLSPAEADVEHLLSSRHLAEPVDGENDDRTLQTLETSTCP